MTFHFMSSIEIIAKLSLLHLIQSERIVMLKINLDNAALTLIFMPKGWKAFLILEKKNQYIIMAYQNVGQWNCAFAIRPWDHWCISKWIFDAARDLDHPTENEFLYRFVKTNLLKISCITVSHCIVLCKSWNLSLTVW